MRFALSARALAAGHRLAAFDTIGSTSTEAMARASAGEPGPLWIVSDHQSQGRGRRGAEWQTARGNLAASLLLTTDLPPATLATLGFVASLALGRALGEVCGERGGASFEPPIRGAPQDNNTCAEPLFVIPGRSEAEGKGILGRRAAALDPLPGCCAAAGVDTREACKGLQDGDVRDGFPPSAEKPSSASLEARPPLFTLKWPNDVLADGAKLAGILLGSEELRDGRRAVVIGTGVNVVAAPADLPYPAASLHGLGCDTNAERLFTALSEHWVDLETLWDGGRGFAAIRKLWIARAVGLGGSVAVRTGAGVTRGIFETIDAHGQLVVRVADGSTLAVSAGEVHFGVAASARPELQA